MPHVFYPHVSASFLQVRDSSETESEKIAQRSNGESLNRIDSLEMDTEKHMNEEVRSGVSEWFSRKWRREAAAADSLHRAKSHHKPAHGWTPDRGLGRP